MKSTLEDLKTRRAVRTYSDEPVPREALEAVLEAGTYAPTARGEQRVCIVAVTNREERDAISRMNAAVMGSTGDPFYGAPVVLVVFGDGSWPFGKLDGSAVMTNLLNAAHAVGLASCWINRAEEVFKTEEGRALKAKWGVPEEYVGVGNVILGLSDARPEPAARKEGFIIYAD